MKYLTKSLIVRMKYQKIGVITLFLNHYVTLLLL